jgi:exodeoxyribonuclease X
MTTYRIVDIESTGIPTPEERHAAVELAYCDLIVPDDGSAAVICEPVAQLVNPGRPIPVEAMAAHHIRDQDVADAPPPTLFMGEMMQGATMFVSFKTDFDREFFGGGAVPWCCAYKAALRVWPQAPAHSLAVLRYWLRLDDLPDFDRDLAMPPHRAGPDAYVCAHLFSRLLAEGKIDDFVRWTKGRALLSRCYFPKHKGKFWIDVAREDRGYLHWIVDKAEDMDPDIRATAKYYLKNPPQPRADGAQL